MILFISRKKKWKRIGESGNKKKLHNIRVIAFENEFQETFRKCNQQDFLRAIQSTFKKCAEVEVFFLFFPYNFDEDDRLMHQ